MLKKKFKEKNNSSNSPYTVSVEKERFASTAASHLSIYNSGPLVIPGTDYRTSLHTQHLCAQAASCSDAEEKC